MKSFSPIEYVKIDIANQFGKDKLSFAQRIAWVDSVKDLRSKVLLAEKPAQYIAAVYALEDAINKVPSGHLVGLDACASGITILGILAGCETTSKNTGIVGNKRMDFYKECTEAMNELLTEDVNVSRTDAKKSTMVHYYGSKAKPKEIFGEDTEELMAFYAAQESIAPGACFMMRELLSSWQPFVLNHSHTLPDGFNAIVPVLQKCKTKVEIDELDHATLTYVYEENVGSEKGLAVAANMTHAVDGFIVRELVRRCNYSRVQLLMVSAVLDANKDTAGNSIHDIERTANDHGFISLRGANFIDAYSVLEFSKEYRKELYQLIQETLAKPSFAVITIHDEFKCHPKYMNHLRECYVTILAELADSTVGQQIIREVRNDPTYILEKISKTLGDQIMKSEYFLS
jgi:hypothetical protein